MNRTLRLEPDPHRFRERVLPFFMADPVARTLPITVLDAVISGMYDEWVLATVQTDAGQVTACAVQTPPHNVIVAASTSDDMGHLVQGLRARSLSFPGVVGLAPLVHDFAAAWCGELDRVAVDDRAERLFRLDVAVPPQPASGFARVATPDDIDLLVAWSDAFNREVGVAGPRDTRHSVAVRIDEGRGWLWESDGQVGSYAAHSPILLGHARLGPVYTPPDLRGHGFASNLVALVSDHLLAQGVVPTLFTNLANATSNAIYRAIGYRSVADAYEVRFVEAPPPRV